MNLTYEDKFMASIKLDYLGVMFVLFLVAGNTAFATENIALNCADYRGNAVINLVYLSETNEAYYELLFNDSYNTYFDSHPVREIKFIQKIENYNYKGVEFSGYLFDQPYIVWDQEKFIISPDKRSIRVFKNSAFSEIRNQTPKFNGCISLSSLEIERITDLGRKFKGKQEKNIHANRRKPSEMMNTNVAWNIRWGRTTVKDKINFKINNNQVSADFAEYTYDRYRGKYKKIHGTQYIDKGYFSGEVIDNKFTGYWIRNKRMDFHSKKCKSKKNKSRYWGRLEIEFLGPIFFAKWGECDEEPIHADFYGERLSQ